MRCYGLRLALSCMALRGMFRLKAAGPCATPLSSGVSSSNRVVNDKQASGDIAASPMEVAEVLQRANADDVVVIVAPECTFTDSFVVATGPYNCSLQADEYFPNSCRSCSP